MTKDHLVSSGQKELQPFSRACRHSGSQPGSPPSLQPLGGPGSRHVRAVPALRRPIAAPSHCQAAPRSPFLGTQIPGRRAARPAPPPARPVTHCLPRARPPPCAAAPAARSPQRPHAASTPSAAGAAGEALAVPQLPSLGTGSAVRWAGRAEAPPLAAAQTAKAPSR